LWLMIVWGNDPVDAAGIAAWVERERGQHIDFTSLVIAKSKQKFLQTSALSSRDLNILKFPQTIFIGYCNKHPT